MIFGIKYLDAVQSSFVLERFVSITGIILLVPIFYPEQDKNIDEVVNSKFTSQTVVIFLRLIMSLLFLGLITACFTLVMHYNGCVFDVPRFWAGTFITAFFLGVLGFTVYGISNNLIGGYLASLAYYLLNFMSGRKLGSFYLFSLSRGEFFGETLDFGAGGIVGYWDGGFSICL